MGLLTPPQRQGRVGFYQPAHLARLELIVRLQDRGYSLAGIRDLLTSWRDGADLGEVLGLAPDDLVHLDEPGRFVTADELARLLPDLLPDRLDDFVAVGLVERCGPDRYCVPSPSLFQLTIDVLAVGYRPEQIVDLLRTIRRATTSIAKATTALLTDRSAPVDPGQRLALATKGRGLLGHGTGRLTIHAIGQLLGVDDQDSTTDALRERLEADH